MYVPDSLPGQPSLPTFNVACKRVEKLGEGAWRRGYVPGMLEHPLLYCKGADIATGLYIILATGRFSNFSQCQRDYQPLFL